MKKPHWRATTLAVAAAVLLGTTAHDANALALGRITVQSALGEPLRADIDIPEINAEEIASLRAAIASPDAFRAAGFEFNSALSGITITLQRRPDGRHFLQLSSPRAINDPFIDMILEANWSSGRIVRDYTLLFDPPALRQSAPPLAAQVPAAPAAAPSARPPAEPPRASAPPVAAAPAPARSPAVRTPAAPAAAPAAAASATAPAAGSGKQLTVQAGDTAGKIAAANKPAGVSLDQMLVALLRSNPDAFIDGNINRLRSGAVVELPSADTVGQTPAAEASRTIVAQSRDFNEFRRRLAEGLPTTRVGSSDRQVSGRVQAQVEEKKPTAAAPDKLTLSKGAVQGSTAATAAADKVARDRAAQDASVRMAEINKNISDLNRINNAAPAGAASGARPGLPLGSASAARSASAPAPAAAALAAASLPKPPASAPATQGTASAPASLAAPASSAAASAPAIAAAPASAPAVASAASAPASAAAQTQAPASAAVAAASAPAATASKPKTAVPVAPPETSLIDDLLENPIVPATVGGLLAFLLGFGFYRAQQRKKTAQVDSSFLESRLQPDSFFGASGGQRIDTNEGSPTGSSMVYSPSQLDAAGDVDPVAEADVYLAYGRDLQAEEILKEAMRTTPTRVAVHSKLLEIYSKRRDAKAFELVATEAYSLTHGAGPEWEHICELGQELDAANPLYRPGGQPPEGTAVAAAAEAVSTGAFGATLVTQALPEATPPVDLDLDLDFSLGDDEPGAAPGPSASPTANHPTLAMDAPLQTQPMPALDMDFGAPTLDLPTATPAPAAAPEPTRLEAPDLNLSLPDDNSLNFTTEPAPAPAPAPAAAQPTAAPAESAGMIEFDLGALSLDLGTPAPPPAPAAALGEAESGASAPSTAGIEDDSDDPLATKLALAQEFNAIGDPDGARSLAQEVLAEASGDLKHKAQRFLAEIS